MTQLITRSKWVICKMWALWCSPVTQNRTAVRFNRFRDALLRLFCWFCFGEFDLVHRYNMRFQIILRWAPLPADPDREIKSNIFGVIQFDCRECAYPWWLAYIAMCGYVSGEIIERRAVLSTFRTNPYQIITKFIASLMIQWMMLLILCLRMEDHSLLMSRTITKRTGCLEFKTVIEMTNAHPESM